MEKWFAVDTISGKNRVQLELNTLAHYHLAWTDKKFKTSPMNQVWDRKERRADPHEYSRAVPTDRGGRQSALSLWGSSFIWKKWNTLGFISISTPSTDSIRPDGCDAHRKRRRATDRVDRTEMPFFDRRRAEVDRSMWEMKCQRNTGEVTFFFMAWGWAPWRFRSKRVERWTNVNNK